MNKPIELFYWPTPNGWKISIALEEFGLPYSVNFININMGDQFEQNFLKIAPNNRMPAIIDPEGPDGKPVSVFESGAILQYLARKCSKYYGSNEREQVVVEQWLMWQMGGVGPMAGQAHHFLKYAPTMNPPNDIPYAKDRYRNEVERLYGVLDRQLNDLEFVAGDYSIADMAIWPWASLWKGQEQCIKKFPNVSKWLNRVGNREAVIKGRALGAEKRENGQMDKKAQEILFSKKSK